MAGFIFKEDGSFVLGGSIDMPVQGVVGEVGFTTNKPLVERLVRIIKSFSPWFKPVDILSGLGPELNWVFIGSFEGGLIVFNIGLGANLA